jgi:hypothetical protein
MMTALLVMLAVLVCVYLGVIAVEFVERFRG